MKRSKNATEFLLVRAQSWADDPVNFAIVQCSPAWLHQISHRLSAIDDVCTNKDFHCVCYWDAPLGYYYIGAEQVYDQGLIEAHEDHAFIIPKLGDLEPLTRPKYKLEGQQLSITRGGIAHFKAFGFGNGVAYWTHEFNLNRILSKHRSGDLQHRYGNLQHRSGDLR